VIAWVRSDSSPGDYSYIVAKGATGCIAASYGLYTGPAGGLMFYVSKSRGSAYTRSPDAGTGVWDGQWHMVIGTYDGGAVRLYVDGNEVGSGTARQGPLEYLLPDSNDFFIGDYPGCEQRGFKGDIDEVSVWGGAFTAAEAQASYQQAIQTPGTQPVPSGPTGVSGPTGTGPVGPTSTKPPVISGLRVSPSSFGVKRVRGARQQSSAVTISYTDTEAARSTLTVYSRQTGVRIGARCVQPRAGAVRKRQTRCVFYRRVGSFAHTDRTGLNRIRFTGVPGHALNPGRYRLDVTPRLSKATGRTVSVAFTVVR
jgi:Concanavalin A-like lectin/glucanases superfamily